MSPVRDSLKLLPAGRSDLLLFQSPENQSLTVLQSQCPQADPPHRPTAFPTAQLLSARAKFTTTTCLDRDSPPPPNLFLRLLLSTTVSVKQPCPPAPLGPQPATDRATGARCLWGMKKKMKMVMMMMMKWGWWSRTGGPQLHFCLQQCWQWRQVRPQSSSRAQEPEEQRSTPPPLSPRRGLQ